MLGSANMAFALCPLLTQGAIELLEKVQNGELRLDRGTKLMVEGWKLPGVNEVPVIVGFRFLGSKVAADFGFMRVLGVDFHGGLPFIPWVGFSVGIN